MAVVRQVADVGGDAWRILATHRTMGSWIAASVGPPILTAALVELGGGSPRDDSAFFYLAVIAAAGLAGGLLPALCAAAISFILVDFFFTPPIYVVAFTGQDLVNLWRFGVTVGIVSIVSVLGERRATPRAAGPRRAPTAPRTNEPAGGDELAAAPEPMTLEEKYEIAVQENRVLRAQLAKLSALLSNREWLTARVIKLLNSERRSLYLIAIGAAAALLLTGGGLGIKAVYDAAHRPAAPEPRVITHSVPVYIEGASLSSPSPSPSPSPGSQPVAAGQPRPSPSAATLLPLPSPSLPVRVKHCPPLPDVPPRCLPISPTPSLPPLP